MPAPTNSISISEVKKAVKKAVETAKRQHPKAQQPTNQNEDSICLWDRFFWGYPIYLPVTGEQTRENLAFNTAVAQNLANDPAIQAMAGGKVEATIITQGERGFVGFSTSSPSLAA